MSPRRRSLLALTSLAIPLTLTAARAAEPAASTAGDVVRLFNDKDFEGWTKWIKHAGKATDPADDSRGVFTVEDGVIHVSGEEFGCLTTRREFADYRLTVDFKWGERRWPPREQDRRDSGILLHCTGPDKVWTKSIECQVQEGDTGDFWLVSGTHLDVGGKPAKERTVKTRDAEKPRGEWNTVEVVCAGDAITNIVNGVVVNEGTHASVTRGRIPAPIRGGRGVLPEGGTPAAEEVTPR